jgi:hypothetical protein
MAFAGQPPFDKNPHDTILSADWNLIGTRMDELDALKINRAGADDMAGPLTIAGALNIGSSVAAEDTLHVRGNTRIEAASPALIVKRTNNGQASGLQLRNSDDSTVAHVHATATASPALAFRVGPPNAPLSVPVRLTIANDGDVGIGTTSIDDRLHVSGGNIRAEASAPAFIAQRSSNTAAAGLQIRNSNNNSIAFVHSSSTLNGDLNFRVGPQNATPTSLPVRMTIANDGDVGIGDTTPDAKLHVANVGDTRLLVSSSFNSISTLDLFERVTLDGLGGRIKYDGSGSNIFSIGTVLNGTESLPLQFRRGVNRVGILTDNPRVPLHIMGGSAANLGNDTGTMVIGDQDGQNLVFDNNEVQARNNGSASTLFLNFWGGGSIWLGGTTIGPGADFAELLESSNKRKLAAGTSVVLDDGKIRAAKKGEQPIGVVTDTPGTLHGVPAEWPKKYLRDEVGVVIKKKKRVEIKKQKMKKIKTERPKMVRRKVKKEVMREEVVKVKGKYVKKLIPEEVTKSVMMPKMETHDLFDEEGNTIGIHEIPVMEEVEEEVEVLDKEDNPVMVGSGKYEQILEPQLNPRYDEKIKYVSRMEREEWNAVALVGQVIIKKDQPVVDSWVKMREVSSDTDLWLIK